MSTPPSQAPTSPPRKSSTPSLFNNEYSRGPLYQYWRERSREASETRDRRVRDAKERASGKQPIFPEPGPSSNTEYQNRLARGLVTQPTPAYEATDSHATVRSEAGVMGDDLPAYENVHAHMAERTPSMAAQGEVAESARDEKERLQRHLAEQEVSEGADEVSAPEIMGADGETAMGKGKEKERKKSFGKDVGTFFGRAFTGYGMKSDGKMNENRW